MERELTIFGRQVMVRATAPFALATSQVPLLSFKLRLLRRLPWAQDHDHRASTEGAPDRCSVDIDFAAVRRLCLCLTRRTAPLCVAVPLSDDSFFLVFQGKHEELVRKTIDTLKDSFLLEIEESPESNDDLISVALVKEAIEYGMKAVFVTNGWTALGSNALLHGDIASWQEGTEMEGILVSVQIQSANQIMFVVSPDVVCFRRFKVNNVLPGTFQQLFKSGNELNLENLLFHRVENINNMKCIVLPSLNEGYITGCCRHLPKGLDLGEFEFLPTKVMPSGDSHYYIQVSFGPQHNCRFWYPSFSVLTNSGFRPASSATRMAKVLSALDKFRSSLSEWDFFKQGKLMIEMSIEKSESFDWIPAKEFSSHPVYRDKVGKLLGTEFYPPDVSSLMGVFNSLDVKDLLNYRRPKPIIFESSALKENNLSPEHGHMQKTNAPYLDLRRYLENMVKIVPKFGPRRYDCGRLRPNEIACMVSKEKKKLTENEHNMEVIYPNFGAKKMAGKMNLNSGDCGMLIPNEIPCRVTKEKNQLTETEHNMAVIFPKFRAKKISGQMNINSDVSKEKNKWTEDKHNIEVIYPKFGAKKLHGKMNLNSENCGRLIPNEVPCTANKEIKRLTENEHNREVIYPKFGAKKLAGKINLKSKEKNKVDKESSSTLQLKSLSNQTVKRKILTGKKQAVQTLEEQKIQASLKDNAQLSCLKQITMTQDIGAQLQCLPQMKIATTSSSSISVQQAPCGGLEVQASNQSDGISKKSSKKRILNSIPVSPNAADVNLNKQNNDKEKKKSGKSGAPEADGDGMAMKEGCTQEVRKNKRSKADIDVHDNEMKVKQKHGEGRLNDLTVPELKSFLSSCKAKVSGKKEELIQRVIHILNG